MVEYINNYLVEYINNYFVEYINNHLVEYINNLLNQNNYFVEHIRLFRLNFATFNQPKTTVFQMVCICLFRSKFWSSVRNKEELLQTIELIALNSHIINI